MSYSKPWIHKAASSLQLPRSPIHLFLIEISSVLSYTVSSSISKAYPGLAKPVSCANVRQIRSVPPKCAEGKNISHFTFYFHHSTHLLLLQTTFMKTKNMSRSRTNNSPLLHPHLQLQTRSQHDVTPISWSTQCELLTWSMISLKSVNPALSCPC